MSAECREVIGSPANPRGISARGLGPTGRGRVDMQAFGVPWETSRAREGGACRVMRHPHPSTRLDARRWKPEAEGPASGVRPQASS
jgi:hypothetical protein